MHAQLTQSNCIKTGSYTFGESAIQTMSDGDFFGGLLASATKAAAAASESMQAAANDAATATSRTAKRTQLFTEIKLAERHILNLKRTFGEEIFQPLVDGNSVVVETILAKYKVEIEAKQVEIKLKQQEAEQLIKEASAASKARTSSMLGSGNGAGGAGSSANTTTSENPYAVSI